MIKVLRGLGTEPKAIEQPIDLSVPENKMMLAFYLATPEVENDRRALNVLHGMRRARKEGRYMGPAPFGYDNKVSEDGRKYIAVNTREAAIVKYAFETVATGQYRVENVYLSVNRMGLKFSKNSFWYMLRNPTYYGKVFVGRYRDEKEMVVAGKHEAIITESLFNDVQDVFDGRKKQYKTTISARDEMQLRGFLICYKCGKLLTGSASTGRNAKYFYCHCNATCGVRFKAEVVNEEFKKELALFVPKGGMPELYTDIINTAYKKTFWI